MTAANSGPYVAGPGRGQACRAGCGGVENQTCDDCAGYRAAGREQGDPKGAEPLARYDLRIRSLERERGEDIYLCSRCDDVAYWSVWLHTPDWGSEGGATYVLCTTHALAAVAEEIEHHV